MSPDPVVDVCVWGRCVGLCAGARDCAAAAQAGTAVARLLCLPAMRSALGMFPAASRSPARPLVATDRPHAPHTPHADYDPREEYPGSAPFSEPEAALMLGVARALRPHVWASVHSGMEALFMPYDHVATVPGEAWGGGREVLHSGGLGLGLRLGASTLVLAKLLGVPAGLPARLPLVGLVQLAGCWGERSPCCPGLRSTRLA